MKRQFSLFGLLLILCAALQSACMKESTVNTESDATAWATRAYGDKAPMIMVYVETNDTNPLNAGDYYLSDGKPLIDLVEFFASNIHKRTVNGVAEPTLYLNPELTRLLEPDPADPDSTGYHKYVKGLQNKGIKVLITVIGDHQGIGLASMNSAQTTQFAQILAHAVEKYNLDGIGFSDHYSDASTNQPSYSEIILKLHALMPMDKLITVNDWGYTSSINAAARACIDYGYHGYWGASNFVTPGIGLDNAHWSPIGLNLGLLNNVRTVRTNSAKAKAQGYGAICNFNLRSRSDTDPLGVFNAYAGGAYNDTVSCEGGDRSQDWVFVPSGFSITMDDVQ